MKCSIWQAESYTFVMIVSKFGGTCCTHHNAAKVKQQVCSNTVAVVVSAVGKTHPTDTKVTDLLMQLHSQLPDVSLFDQIAQKYQKLAKKCQYNQIDTLLLNTITDIVTKNSYFNTVSKGEEMSAKIFAHYLDMPYVDAETLFAFDGTTLDVAKTFCQISSAYNQHKRFVTGGFYGANSSSRVLFSRGGSDVSAALIASALNCSLYQNFTDVNGVCLANPSTVTLPQTVRCISYDDMYLMAKLGAQVLHPDAVTYSRIANVPINVRSIYNPTDYGTLVSSASSPSQLLGVTQQTGENQTIITNVSHSLDGFFLLSELTQCLASFPNLQVFSVNQSQNLITIVTDMPIIQAINNCLLTNGKF